MNIYKGYRPRRVTVTNEEGISRQLKSYGAICHDSPTGFEWGYGGSGPAQLAFALLYNATNDEDIAFRFKQSFKFDIVADLPDGRGEKGVIWELKQSQILDWIKNKVGEK